MNRSLFMLILPACLLYSVSAVGDVTLDISQDRIFLSDGSVVECTFLCKGTLSVIVLMGGEERTYPADHVIRIERGTASGERKIYRTGPVGGVEKIVSGLPSAATVPPPPSEDTPQKDRREERSGRPRKEKEAKRPRPASEPAEKKKGEEQSSERKKIETFTVPGKETVEKLKTELGGDSKTEELLDKLESLKGRFSRTGNEKE